MSCKSTTEWVGYPLSTRVQRDSLPSFPAVSGEDVGIHYSGQRTERQAYSGDGITFEIKINLRIQST